MASRHPAAAPVARVVLEAREVSKRYGAVWAVDRVDLRVQAGTIVGLVGPNGSGKTTFLRAAAGLVPVERGSILVAGAPAGSRAARAQTAFVPDEPTGFDELTGREFVALVHALWSAGSDAASRAELLAATFGVAGRVDQRLGTLSRGLRRQISAVAAFSLAPPLVLVDEAAATLDPEAVVVLGEALGALAARGSAVVLATQDLHFAGAVCDEIGLLHRGRLVDRGTVEDMLFRHDAASLEEVVLATLGEGMLRERVRDAFRAL